MLAWYNGPVEQYEENKGIIHVDNRGQNGVSGQLLPFAAAVGVS